LTSGSKKPKEPVLTLDQRFSKKPKEPVLTLDQRFSKKPKELVLTLDRWFSKNPKNWFRPLTDGSQKTQRTDSDP
jgi:hypothetical protein